MGVLITGSDARNVTNGSVPTASSLCMLPGKRITKVISDVLPD